MMAVAEALVEDARRTRSFEEFFHVEYERLLRVLYLSTGDRHEAEDLAQEAFVRVYEHWTRVGSLENPAGYLYRVALNARRSRLRRVRVAAAKALRLRPDPAADPQEAAEDRETVRRALATLPPGQRDAVVLIEWLGLTDAEAGGVLGLSPGAVRTRLHRARSALRDLLRGEDDV
jgi:RNA polymerase sigma-70 factor (sigma-E family)